MDIIITNAEKKDAKKLPNVKNVKVKVNRNKVNEGGKREANGFIVLVEIEGKGWFNENAVLHHYGFKTVSGTFKTYEKAKAEAASIMAKWGKVTGKKAKADAEREAKIRERVIAEMAKMKPEEIAAIFAKVA